MPNQQEPAYERLYDMLDMIMLLHHDGPVTFRQGLEVMMDYEIAERDILFFLASKLLHNYIFMYI